jgi:hypothetical protein
MHKVEGTTLDARRTKGTRDGGGRVRTVHVVSCGLVVLLMAQAPVSAQHPTAATQQALPAPRAEKPGAGAQATEGPPPVSLEDLAKRISAVIAGQGGAATGTGAESDRRGSIAGGAAAATRSKPASPRPVAGARTASLVTLRWDASLASDGVSLAWDAHLDPRRAGRANLGVRLVWPERRP